MCDFLCVGLAADRDIATRLKPAEIYPKECTDTPVGRAVIGGKAGRRAYFLTDGHCSCALFLRGKERLRRVEAVARYREAVLPPIRECVEAHHSVSLLRHWMSGNAWAEPVTPTREERITLPELAEAWTVLERDVRYLILAEQQWEGSGHG